VRSRFQVDVMFQGFLWFCGYYYLFLRRVRRLRAAFERGSFWVLGGGLYGGREKAEISAGCVHVLGIGAFSPPLPYEEGGDVGMCGSRVTHSEGCSLGKGIYSDGLKEEEEKGGNEGGEEGKGEVKKFTLWFDL
jgi:hypothetical protein